MRKKYSLAQGDFMRFHPITLIFIASFILLIFTTGIVKIISSIIFLITLVYVLIWLYLTIKKFWD